MKYYPMIRKLVFIILIFTVNTFFCQEMVCDVAINAEQTGLPNLSVFKTLETSLEEFVNQTKWTDVEYLPQEKVDCSFFINISSFSDTSFTASIQVQASRPVYNSGYKSTLANFSDNNFAFTYVEYQPLEYNENAFQSNLISVISYYVYTILGLQADSYSLNGGTPYYQTANQIVNMAQSSGFDGWQSSSDTQSRFRYNDDILSGTFSGYRAVLYKYHREALDIMADDTKIAKKVIISVIDDLYLVNKKRPNSYIMRTFFDAKNSEISRILSGGAKLNISDAVDILKSISPTYNDEWMKIIN